MKKTLFLSAAIVLASTSAAHASDFNGFRVEVQTGLDVSSAKTNWNEVTIYDGGPGETDSEIVRTNATGVQFGAGIGYDAEISSNIVAGIEANIAFSNAKLKGLEIFDGVEIVDNDDELNIDYLELDQIKAKREIEFAARIGYKVNPTTLIYAKGGYVNGRFKISGENATSDSLDYDDYEFADYSYSKNRSGYRIGGGIETLIGNNAFVKLEYRYTNFKDFQTQYEYFDNYNYDGETSQDEKYNVALSRHQLALGLGFRF